MDFRKANEELEDKIRAIEQTDQKRILTYSKIISVCVDYLQSYRKAISRKKLRNKSEEVIFFKVHKQIPLTHLIYFEYLNNLELEAPIAGEERIKYLKKKIRKINKFYAANKHFVQYIELDQTHLDHFYFTRRFNEKMCFSKPSVYYQDPNFTTSGDFLLGKLLAYEKLLPFFHKELENLRLPSSLGQEGHSTLHWTSSKVALIELIYALQHSGTINNGSVDLITIATSFEDFFQIKLDNIYKTYSEIKLRKGRRTKFLDELTIRFEQKLDQDEEL